MLNSFREGNRSELLADYMLSAIGISTPIRRQDDFGFDFYCHLSNDNDDKYLTFGFPFIIQIKSSSIESILYGDKNPEKWRAEKILWLFRNEIPFFIGIVDKKNICIKLYDTTGLWQLYKNGEASNCSQIELIPTFHEYGERRENRKVEKLENWAENKGDGYKYIIDMGNPIIDISYSDLQAEDKNILITKKNILRRFIAEEQINIMHRKLGVIGFNEFKQNSTNSGDYIETGMELRGGDEKAIDNIYTSFRTGLISLFMNLYAQGRNEEVNSLKNLLQYIPPAHYYKQLYDQNNELFDWVLPLLKLNQ